MTEINDANLFKSYKSSLKYPLLIAAATEPTGTQVDDKLVFNADIMQECVGIKKDDCTYLHI